MRKKKKYKDHDAQAPHDAKSGYVTTTSGQVAKQKKRKNPKDQNCQPMSLTEVSSSSMAMSEHANVKKKKNRKQPYSIGDITGTAGNQHPRDNPMESRKKKRKKLVIFDSDSEPDAS